MNRNFIILFLCISLCSLLACNEYKQGEGDMLYKIEKDESGPSIREGELVELVAIQRTEEDSVIWDSRHYDRNALVKREKSIFKGDLFAALGHLSEGDSATVKISIDSMVASMGAKKPENTKSKYFLYTLSIKKVLPKGDLSDSLYTIKVDQFMKLRAEALKNTENSKIKAYLTSKKIKPQITASGLYYTISKSGNGERALIGDTVEVNYTGTFLSGKIFDTTRPDLAKKAGIPFPPDKPRSFVAGLNTTIQGLEEVLISFREGTRATIIVPSKLGFAENGYEGIQPYTPLVYDLEIVSVRHVKGKRPVEPGASIPTFAFTNIENNVVVQNEDLPKEKMLFFMFDPECDHCQHEIESIGKEYQKFSKIKLFLVSQASPEEMRIFKDKYGSLLAGKKNVTWLYDMDRKLIGTFQSKTFPSVYVYSANQKLVKCFMGQTPVPELVRTINSQ